MGQIWENFKVESNIVVQQLSYVRLCHPMNTEHQASLSFTVSWILLKLMSIELMKVILDTEKKNRTLPGSWRQGILVRKTSISKGGDVYELPGQ